MHPLINKITAIEKTRDRAINHVIRAEIPARTVC